MPDSDIFSRTQTLFGEKAMAKLAASRVAVFGLGGVGSYVVEALARGGTGALDLIDNDIINPSNINRQIYALHSTIGKYKLDIAKKRIADINPECNVTIYKLFFLPETASQIDFTQFDYVADCIDTVTGKLKIIEKAKKAGVPVISSMGTGNKTDPLQLKVTDISKTSICPLARVMRRELKKRGIQNVKVVYSTENPTAAEQCAADSDQKNILPCTEYEKSVTSNRQIPGSTSFVPPAAGLIIAGEIIKDLISIKSDNSTKSSII